MKVVVLGASGMLGSMVLDYLSSVRSLELTATVRSTELMRHFEERVSGVEWQLFDAESGGPGKISSLLSGAAWAINAIGVIKPYVHDDNPAEVKRAIVINALFPHYLATVAEQTGCRVIQIATDCAYSGAMGSYRENDSHDPLDVYGKTKSLGEVFSPQVHHLRCSIIGPEPKGHVSLLDWFLGQPRGAAVSGYTNHRWNGITTLQFTRLCRGIIENNLAPGHLQHVIPTGAITKAEMLECFAREFRRPDITINPAPAPKVIDRTLATINPSLNEQLWKAAGYPSPPVVPEMVAELAAYKYRFAAERQP